MWISVPCGCGGSNGFCCHCGGLGLTWRLSMAERRADNDNHCIDWMRCPLCNIHIHRGSFLAHVEITHRTTWAAVEQFVTSMRSPSPQRNSSLQLAGYLPSGNSLKRISKELNLAIEHLIPRQNVLRFMRNLSLPARHARSHKAESNRASLKQIFRSFAHRLHMN